MAKTAGRPVMQVSLLSSEGHFRVHYDSTGVNKPAPTDTDRNGVPDYIDSTLVYLEYAWNLEVNQLGYEEPLSDDGIGGGDEIDIYILDFGKGGYGITFPDHPQNGMASAYIELDNNYAE
ncbi:hypothetical protein LLG96_12955, partial [bacterium]|nr:hypothetical protein [bacterium]